MADTGAMAQSPMLNATIEDLITATTSPITTALNTYFVLNSGFLVFTMQLGFALLTVGCVRMKSARSICLKNLLDASVGVLGYYLLGWGFAYGDKQSCDADGICTNVENGFIGSTSFGMHDVPSTSFQTWFFQYVFAVSTATIVSGAVAERITMLTYVLYAFFLTAWVYPVLSHWVWSPAGWASTTRTTGPLFLGTGVYDTVGSGAVHMVGGVAALMGAWIAGPRIGRFDANGKPRPMPGHNSVFYVSGVLLLWFGFYGFNPGTMGQLIALDGSNFSNVVARCVISTTMGGGFGGVTGVLVKLIVSKLRTGHGIWDLGAGGNGALIGMVVITSGCATYTPWAAALGGIVGGLIYLPSTYLFLNILKVDDPVEATTVHLTGGAAGVIWYALMAEKEYTFQLYGETLPDGGQRAYGWWRGDGPTLLWANIVWCFVIFGWTAFWMGSFFYILKFCKLLRVPPEDEMVGMDISHHGGKAYLGEEEDLEQRIMSKTSAISGHSNDSDKSLEVDALRAEVLALTKRIELMETGTA